MLNFQLLLITAFICCYGNYLSAPDEILIYQMGERHHHESPRGLKIKRLKAPTLYYSNSTSTFNLIISGDIEVNPGPGLPKPKCPCCEKTVRSNQKRLMCGHCFDMVHATCVNLKHLVNNSKTHVNWTCNNCLFHELPFNNVNRQFYRTRRINPGRRNGECLYEQHHRQQQFEVFTPKHTVVVI